MENKNKTIIILLAVILILGIVLGIKISTGNSNIEVINNSSIVESQNETKNTAVDELNSDLAENTGNNNLVINIINVVVMLAIVPILLRKYNILTCTIIMVLYRIIIALFIGGNLFSFGILGALIIIIFNFIYYYILLWFIEKVLLDASPITYFFGICIAEVIISYVSQVLLAMVIAYLFL